MVCDSTFSKDLKTKIRLYLGALGYAYLAKVFDEVPSDFGVQESRVEFDHIEEDLEEIDDVIILNEDSI